MQWTAPPPIRAPAYSDSAALAPAASGARAPRVGGAAPPTPRPAPSPPSGGAFGFRGSPAYGAGSAGGAYGR